MGVDPVLVVFFVIFVYAILFVYIVSDATSFDLLHLIRPRLLIPQLFSTAHRVPHHLLPLSRARAVAHLLARRGAADAREAPLRLGRLDDHAHLGRRPREIARRRGLRVLGQIQARREVERLALVDARPRVEHGLAGVRQVEAGRGVGDRVGEDIRQAHLLLRRLAPGGGVAVADGAVGAAREEAVAGAKGNARRGEADALLVVEVPMVPVQQPPADEAAGRGAVAALEARVVDELELAADPERVHVQAGVHDVGPAGQRGREGGGGGGGRDDVLWVGLWTPSDGSAALSTVESLNLLRSLHFLGACGWAVVDEVEAALPGRDHEGRCRVGLGNRGDGAEQERARVLGPELGGEDEL